MPMTKKELEAEVEHALDYPDGIEPFAAISIVCDLLDLEPLRVLAKIRMEMRLTEKEYVIHDLLESSQSNLKRSLYKLHRAAAATELLQRLDEQEMLNSDG